MLSEDVSNLVFTTLASLSASALTISGFRKFFSVSHDLPSQNTTMLIIDDDQEYGNPNLQFRSVDIYLSTVISPSSKRLRVLKDRDMKQHVYTLDTDQHLIDIFQSIHVKWRLIFRHVEETEDRLAHYIRCYELTFERKHEETMLYSYLPYIVERAKRMIEECKITRLYQVNFGSGVTEYPFEFDHPIRLENLAVDSGAKCRVKDDLKRFKNGREWDYKCNGKAWKKGYLISGGPGSGKSSLIAAMANELEYDIYDFDIAEVFERKNSEYLDDLISCYLPNKSMLVIEDFDSILESEANNHKKLEELLGLINEAWFKCGDEKVIILTTTNEVDPKLLEGIIDFKIEMPNCNYSAFKQLAFNHFGITNHELYQEIQRILNKLGVSLSEVVTELMKSSDVEIALQGLVAFLLNKLN